MDRLASTLLPAMLLLAACGGGDGGSPSGPSGQQKSISITLAQTDFAVPAGGSTDVGVTVGRGGGFTGSVGFTLEGVPSGVTVTISSIPGSATTGTMTVAAASTAASGRYLVTVQAQGSGVNEGGKAQFWVTVQPPPDYSLRMARDTLSVAQGAAGTVDVNVTRAGGFAGSVTLTLEGAPTGVTGTFAPNPAAADKSTLSLSVGASVAAGKYTLTVKGAATGLSAHTATFVLDVVADNTPGFTLTLSPAAITVVSGGAAVPMNAILHRTGGYTGGVNFTVQGQPTGVTASFTTSPVTDTLVTLTFTAALALTGGTYPLTITARATGYPDRQATLQLTVQESPGFWITLSHSSITTANGASPQTVSIQITRTGGFSDSVHFSLNGMPAGITVVFNPAATTGTSATVTIAAINVAAGTYTGTMRASATGQLDRAGPFTVIVSAAATDVVWRFCGSPAPVFFALQDGVSPWTVLSQGQDGTWVSSVASGKGAVAFVVPGLPDTATAAAVPVAGVAPRRARATLAGGYTTYIYYGNVADLQAVAASTCVGARKTVRGSVAGVPASDAWTVALDGSSAIALPGAASSFTLSDVLVGARDLVAARAVPATKQILADAFVLRRDVDAADGSTLPVVDFTAAEAFAPATGTLTVNGLPGGASTGALIGFMTANGTSAVIGQLDSVTSGARTIAGVPAVRLRAGDLHTLQSTSEWTGFTLVATLYARQVGSWNINLPGLPASPTADVYATSPYIRLRARGTLGAQGGAFGGLVRATFIQTTAQRATVIYDSRNYIGSTSSFELRTGGYNTLSGWNEASYGFQAGATVRWTVELRTAGYSFTPADGSVVHTFSGQGSVTP